MTSVAVLGTFRLMKFGLLLICQGLQIEHRIIEVFFQPFGHSQFVHLFLPIPSELCRFHLFVSLLQDAELCQTDCWGLLVLWSVEDILY